MTSIAVLGPGGVGGFLAGALVRAGGDATATVLAREPTAELIERRGLEVQSVVLGDFLARPRATAILSTPVDVLLVATKATGLVAALARVQVEPGLVVPLLNGLDHMARLREWFPARVAAGTIRIESDQPAPGRIVQTSPFLRVDLAADEEALGPDVENLATMLRRAGIPVEVGASEAQILWSKLVRLNALACTTSAADRSIGFIRRDPEWREALRGCIDEAAAVASAEGARIDPAQALAELDAAHTELGSSMQRDIAAGREPELDAIAGAVLRAAERHGLRCATVARLAVQIAERAGIGPPSAAVR
ncbi:MAG: 2-dehydropantoate 2-reductase [Solirubrobacterales bacterium]|nr:MAG: 2-dehydropantoate 2-reductase [Solirubrobacterales bacterium]